MTRHLLLLGGGVMQIPAVQWAHRLGVKVVCFDANPRAQARDLVDYFEVCDIKDPTQCLSRAQAHRKAYRLDGVVTVGTDFSTTVSWVAEHLGLHATPYESALCAKDKGRMRARFLEAGVASPQYQVINPDQDAGVHVNISFPAVVKPTDSMGARGVKLVHDRTGLLQAVEQARAFSSQGQVIVEEFIDGPEFSLDAIVRDGKVIRCGFADRTIVFPPNFVEIGHCFPSLAAPEIKEAVWDEFERGVQALGITHGAAKGDVKFSPTQGRAVIGEIANRLSGGYMSGWTYPLFSGRSAILWAIQTALGDGLSDQGNEASVPVVERAWIGMPGVLKAIEGQERARGLPGVREIFLSVTSGQRTVFPRNNVEKLGNLIATADTMEAAQASARNALNCVRFLYQQNNPETDRFLTGEGPEPWWFPQARPLVPRSGMRWRQRAEQEGWKDVYGNAVSDLLAVLESEGITASDDEGFWRAFLVGGLAGARYWAGQS